MLDTIDIQWEYPLLNLTESEIHEALSKPNPLFPTETLFKENPNLFWAKIMKDPANIYFTCKHLLNIELAPFQVVILQEMWHRTYPMLIGTRGLGKSFLLAVYCVLKALIQQGSKIVICGSGFRQSKIIFAYVQGIWNNAPILQQICISANSRSDCRIGIDQCVGTFGKSTVTAIPIGDGKKIRGLRANIIVMDEFASVQREVYETVIEGFGAVSLSPIEAAKARARQKILMAKGIPVATNIGIGNQSIISGTAHYDFTHYGEYWKRYHAIIKTRGDKDKLTELFGEEPPEHFNWKDYSIIRIPYEHIPEGFMDDKTIARAKATQQSTIYAMEYGACFARDSLGFFKRTLLDKCTCSDHDPITIGNKTISFSATTKGSPDKQYVFGIDTASEKDNFSIVILELWEDHRRIVYCWTTNKKAHREKLQKNLTPENDFYSFCARKIRDLMKLFPTNHIAIDSQGGGYAIAEALHDRSRLKQDELPLWPIIEDDKPQDSDGYDGLHVLKMIHFSNYDWTSSANHALKQDFEDRRLIFPYFDSLSLAISAEDDELNQRLYDTLEDCTFEIEELKYELATIVVTKTPSGRERWDTPEVKDSAHKKGRLHKDRYTSLLMANAVARDVQKYIETIKYQPLGMAVGQKLDGHGNYQGPQWFTSQKRGCIGMVVKR